MRLFSSKKYNERALYIERYILKNKLFFFIAVVLIIFLIGNEIKSNNTYDKHEQSVIQMNVEEDEAENKDEIPHWRFYSIDLWILLIGGGICTTMIIRERRKSKEKLR